MSYRKSKNNQLPFAHINVLTKEQLNKLLDDQEFCSSHLSKIPLHLLEDKKILMKLTKQHLYFPDLLELLSHRFKSDVNNKDIFLRILTRKHSGHCMKKMPNKWRGDLDFALNILQKYKDKTMHLGWTYKDLHNNLKQRKQVALLAIDARENPRELLQKFKNDKDFLMAHVKAAERYSDKYNYSLKFDIQHFNLNKMDLSADFLAELIQKDPSTYCYFSPKHKRLKKLAWMSIKADIRSYKDLPDKLKQDIQIINYVVARDPKVLVDNLSNKSLRELNFSHLDLSKKAQDYIYRAVKKELIANKADVLEIAKCKAGIYSYPRDNTNAKSFNNWHFSKAEVLKTLASTKCDFRYTQIHQLFANISYELKFDLDVISQFIISSDSEVVQFCRHHHLPERLSKDITKILFSKGRYKGISLPVKGKVRDYMLQRLCDAARNERTNSHYYYSTSKYDLQGLLSAKEQKKYINKYPLLLLDFTYNVLIENSKHLSKHQKLRIIDQHKSNDLLNALSYGEKFNFFGGMFKQNITLAKKIILDWPEKEMCRNIDFEYFCNKPSFNAFLANIEEITIHHEDFRGLPAVLKNNKLFIKKALNYDLRLYRKIGKSFQMDREITDWVFAIEPHLAQCLSSMQFNKLDTTNLHPIARKVIYGEYLAKYSASDVLENAIMKQKLLQINPSEDQAA